MPDEPDTQPLPGDGEEPRPTEPPPQPDEPAQPPRPRLTRSSTDSLIGGVAGGIGKHLGVDPLAIRITFVILTFAGGLGLLAYLACLVLLPSDDPEAEPLQWGLWRTLGAGLLAVAAIAILVPNWLWGPELGILLIAGVILYVLSPGSRRGSRSASSCWRSPSAASRPPRPAARSAAGSRWPAS